MSKSGPPTVILELAARTVDQVRAAVGVELTYDSETLPIIDHYLRLVPKDSPETILLIAATAGAYFGEVVRRSMGGEWDVSRNGVIESQLRLPWGLSFSPPAIVAAAVLASDEFEPLEGSGDTELDTSFDAPGQVLAYVRDTLESMSAVSEEEYYSLCGRFDTLEHLNEVVPVRVASN